MRTMSMDPPFQAINSAVYAHDSAETVADKAINLELDQRIALHETVTYLGELYGEWQIISNKEARAILTKSNLELLNKLALLSHKMLSIPMLTHREQVSTSTSTCASCVCTEVSTSRQRASWGVVCRVIRRRDRSNIQAYICTSIGL
ncbi:hypothetical protein Plhal304r1_c048g0129901 [Plasmopara halstedii]